LSSSPAPPCADDGPAADHGPRNASTIVYISVGLLELPGRHDVYRVVEVMVLSVDQAAEVEKRLEGEF
jgi:hypothetical protein